MPQRSSTTELKNIEIDYKDVQCQFYINPDEMIQQETSRSTVTQTVGSAYIDDFGGGLPTIYIKGNTGFSNGLGVTRFMQLRNLIRQYYNATTPGQDVTDEIVFHNYTDDESWVVHTDPQGFRLLRNNENPLLYMYEIYFICIRPWSQPKQSSDYSNGVNQGLGSSLAKANTSVAQTSYQAALPPLRYALGVDGSGNPSVQLVSYTGGIQVSPNGQIIGSNGTTINVPGSLSAAANQTLATITQEITPQFDNTVTLSAVSTMNQMITNGQYYLPTDIFPEDTFQGQIADITNMRFDNTLTVAMKSVLLESINIYQQVMNSPDLFSVNIADADIKRVIGNIRYITYTLYQQSNPNYMLISIFRTLEKILAYFINSELYNQQFQSELDSYNQAVQDGAQSLTGMTTVSGVSGVVNR